MEHSAFEDFFLKVDLMVTPMQDFGSSYYFFLIIYPINVPPVK